MKINLNKRKKILCFLGLVLIIIILFIIYINTENKIDSNKIRANDKNVKSGSNQLSNTKIEWGISRAKNHEQPDLGSKNQELISKYNGIALGNNQNKYVYLTFDLGYEAGYTENILDVLKETEVKATFFVTAHYVNSASDLVQRMIDDGHIIGNHTPHNLMSISC